MLGEHPNVGVNTLEMNIGMTLLFIDLGGERRLDMSILTVSELSTLSILAVSVSRRDDVRPQRIDDFSGFDVHENLESILTSSDAAADFFGRSCTIDEMSCWFHRSRICQPRDRT